MSDVTEILVEARELISDPDQWTQIFYACDAQDSYTEWDSPEAARWSATGAIAKAAGAAYRPLVLVPDAENNTLVVSALDEFRRAIGDHNVSKFNDTHNHAEVMAAFDKAIVASRSTVQ